MCSTVYVFNHLRALLGVVIIIVWTRSRRRRRGHCQQARWIPGQARMEDRARVGVESEASEAQGKQASKAHAVSAPCYSAGGHQRTSLSPRPLPPQSRSPTTLTPVHPLPSPRFPLHFRHLLPAKFHVRLVLPFVAPPCLSARRQTPD